ncbi:MAG: SRPBCC domain-containing protein [Chrysiogenales bacterium]|nr:MAG: SRPBCC domain-containing protein [Chrysiogenales bacterium]
MKRIGSEIEIDVPAARVWKIITDFDAYPRWNRFTPRITLTNGKFREGAEFELDCAMTPRRLLRNERETILAVEPEVFRFCMGTSRTRGRPGIRSFRWQICEPIEGDRTRFVNHEEFRGPLAPLVRLIYGRRLKSAFDEYCRSLKKFSEDERT